MIIFGLFCSLVLYFLSVLYKALHFLLCDFVRDHSSFCRTFSDRLPLSQLLMAESSVAIPDGPVPPLG